MSTGSKLKTSEKVKSNKIKTAYTDITNSEKYSTICASKIFKIQFYSFGIKISFFSS